MIHIVTYCVYIQNKVKKILRASSEMLIEESAYFDFDFDVTRFWSLQSEDHVQVLKTETDWPGWSEDGANQIVIVTI